MPSGSFLTCHVFYGPQCLVQAAQVLLLRRLCLSHPPNSLDLLGDHRFAHATTVSAMMPVRAARLVQLSDLTLDASVADERRMDVVTV